MGTNKEQDGKHDAYEDFLTDISGQFGGRDEEKEFLDNISSESPQEDIRVNVGLRLKTVRKDRKLSLTDVAQRTDLSVSLLEEIEDGELTPPLGTVIKLAKALDLKMGYFISGEDNLPHTIVRKHDHKVISRYNSQKGKHYGYGYESLAPRKKDRHMEPFLVTLAPSETEEERSAHDGQEFIFVLEGKMQVRLGSEIHILEPGDSIYYDSTVPHLVKCGGEKETRILAVLYSEK
jgi:quercetin dioxygenase-like cupin family protein/ribosome-binding protein aMBF1 (putative translation factor)